MIRLDDHRTDTRRHSRHAPPARPSLHFTPRARELARAAAIAVLG